MKLEMRVKVTTRLRCRTGAGLSFPYSNTDYLYNGDIIIATEQQNGWYRHSKGWSSGEYLIKIKDLETNSTTNPVAVPPQPTAPVPNPAPFVEPNAPQQVRSNIHKQPEKRKNNYITNDLKEALRSTGWNNDIYFDKFNEIHRFGYKDFDGICSTKEYVFFTKPDLYIYEDHQGRTLNPKIANDPLFIEIHKRCPEVLHQLQSSVTINSSPFMNLLYNTRRSKVELPNISSKEIETSSTQFGTRMYFKKHSFESDENHDFTIEFEDMKDLKVYYLFKAWNHYSNLKSIGVIEPKDVYRNNMEVHDQISIYKFIVSEIGDEIVFFAKITGCYAKTTPRDFFSDISGDRIAYNISWKGHFIDDVDPLIVYEFNNLTNNLKGSKQPLYDNKNNRVDHRWSKYAYVERYDFKNKPGFTYKLKWRR